MNPPPAEAAGTSTYEALITLLPTATPGNGANVPQPALPPTSAGVDTYRPL